MLLGKTDRPINIVGIKSIKLIFCIMKLSTLCRQLKLNAIPHSLEFVDSKGTLIVGVGKNLHKIDSVNSEFTSCVKSLLPVGNNL